MTERDHFTREELLQLAAEIDARRKANDQQAARRIGKPLTPRQRDCLDLAAQGMTNRQIAAALGIAPPTVKNHMSGAMARLGARNRTEAVRKAAERLEIELRL